MLCHFFEVALESVVAVADHTRRNSTLKATVMYGYTTSEWYEVFFVSFQRLLIISMVGDAASM